MQALREQNRARKKELKRERESDRNEGEKKKPTHSKSVCFEDHQSIRHSLFLRAYSSSTAVAAYKERPFDPARKIKIRKTKQEWHIIEGISPIGPSP